MYLISFTKNKINKIVLVFSIFLSNFIILNNILIYQKIEVFLIHYRVWYKLSRSLSGVEVMILNIKTLIQLFCIKEHWSFPYLISFLYISCFEKYFSLSNHKNICLYFTNSLSCWIEIVWIFILKFGIQEHSFIYVNWIEEFNSN